MVLSFKTKGGTGILAYLPSCHRVIKSLLQETASQFVYVYLQEVIG